MIGLAVLLYVSAIGAPAMAIPVYGSTRYGRPSTAAVAPPPAPFYYRPARFYPYTENYNDLYYRPMPVVHYPYYRPEDMYRNVHAYYYSPYYYGNEEQYEPSDNSDNSHLDNPSRSDALPIGQETWFEGDSNAAWRNDYDDVNAAFLQNLILSQMFDDAADKSSSESVEDTNKDSNGDGDLNRANHEYYGERDTRDFEDEDVRELKALAGKPLYHVPKTSLQYPVNHKDDAYRSQLWHTDFSTPKPVVREDDHIDDYQNDEGWINWGSKRNAKSVASEAMKKFATKKPIINLSSSSTTTPKPILNGKIPATVITLGGQKEEVLLRPATPARQPFPEPVLHMLESNNLNQNKRSPSVYDTIKRLLTMEESYKPNSEKRSRMQKRFISTEEDLVGELRGLKLRRRSTA